MADEILYAGIADQTTAETLSAELLLLNADRNALPNHPAILYCGDVTGKGSRVLKVPHLGLLGYNVMTAATEGTDQANTPLTDGSSTLSVSQYTKVYEASDIARMVDANGMLNGQAFALDAIVSAMATLRTLIADIVDGFTAIVGSTGVDATIANYLDLITTLEIAKVLGPFMFIGHPVQWGDIRKDAGLNSGGAIQWNAGSQDLLDRMKGLGYQGEYLGIANFTTTDVPTANSSADRAGGMFGAGGVLWADGTIPGENNATQLFLDQKVLFEVDRNARGNKTAYVGHRMLAASKGIDACGVSLITDA